jgi:transcriptional regulator of acetoin/glycerol metabolism
MTQRTLAEVVKETIEQALKDAGGNVSLAGRNLGVSRSTIFRKAKQLGVPVGEKEGAKPQESQGDAEPPTQ